MTITERINTMEAYQGNTVCPADFAAHWQEKLNKVSNLNVQHEEVPFCNKAAVYELLHITMPDGSVVDARYIRPAGGGKFPTALMFHDLGRSCRGWHHMTRFVGLGYAVIALENRIDKSKILADLTAEELERAYLDALAVGNAARSLPNTDTEHMAAWGEGFGGGLGLMVSALLPVDIRCGCLHPMPADLPENLAEYDLVNFAQRLHAPLLMGTALMDEVASPESQYAVYNHAECEKHHFIYPKYIHERINAFENEYVKFLHIG